MVGRTPGRPTDATPEDWSVPPQRVVPIGFVFDKPDDVVGMVTVNRSVHQGEGPGDRTGHAGSACGGQGMNDRRVGSFARRVPLGFWDWLARGPV